MAPWENWKKNYFVEEKRKKKRLKYRKTAIQITVCSLVGVELFNWLETWCSCCCCCCFFFTSCSADLISSSVTPCVDLLVSLTRLACAFLWVSDSSSRTGGTNDLQNTRKFVSQIRNFLNKSVDWQNTARETEWIIVKWNFKVRSNYKAWYIWNPNGGGAPIKSKNSKADEFCRFFFENFDFKRVIFDGFYSNVGFEAAEKKEFWSLIKMFSKFHLFVIIMVKFCQLRASKIQNEVDNFRIGISRTKWFTYILRKIWVNRKT